MGSSHLNPPTPVARPSRRQRLRAAAALAAGIATTSACADFSPSWASARHFDTIDGSVLGLRYRVGDGYVPPHARDDRPRHERGGFGDDLPFIRAFPDGPDEPGGHPASRRPGRSHEVRRAQARLLTDERDGWRPPFDDASLVLAEDAWTTGPPGRRRGQPAEIDETYHDVWARLGRVPGMPPGGGGPESGLPDSALLGHTISVRAWFNGPQQALLRGGGRSTPTTPLDYQAMSLQMSIPAPATLTLPLVTLILRRGGRRRQR